MEFSHTVEAELVLTLFSVAQDLAFFRFKKKAGKILPYKLYFIRSSDFWLSDCSELFDLRFGVQIFRVIA